MQFKKTTLESAAPKEKPKPPPAAAAPKKEATVTAPIKKKEEDKKPAASAPKKVNPAVTAKKLPKHTRPKAKHDEDDEGEYDEVELPTEKLAAEMNDDDEQDDPDYDDSVVATAEEEDDEALPPEDDDGDNGADFIDDTAVEDDAIEEVEEPAPHRMSVGVSKKKKEPEKPKKVAPAKKTPSKPKKRTPVVDEVEEEEKPKKKRTKKNKDATSDGDVILEEKSPFEEPFDVEGHSHDTITRKMMEQQMYIGKMTEAMYKWIKEMRANSETKAAPKRAKRSGPKKKPEINWIATCVKYKKRILEAIDAKKLYLEDLRDAYLSDFDKSLRDLKAPNNGTVLQEICKEHGIPIKAEFATENQKTNEYVIKEYGGVPREKCKIVYVGQARQLTHHAASPWALTKADTVYEESGAVASEEDMVTTSSSPVPVTTPAPPPEPSISTSSTTTTTIQ